MSEYNMCDKCLEQPAQLCLKCAEENSHTKEQINTSELAKEIVEIVQKNVTKDTWCGIRKKIANSLPSGKNNTSSPKYSKFEDLWKSVGDIGAIGGMNRAEVKRWSNIVFDESRL